MLARAVIRARVEGITRILTIPPVVDRIVHLTRTGTVSAAEVAEEISTDQVLAAKVLKLVNSGFYGFRGMWLLKKWSLAPRLVYPIAYHHNFHPRRDFADRTAVIHLADVLCRAIDIGYPGDAGIPRMNQEAWATVGMGMSDIERICSTINDEVQDGLVG